jgi:predicted HAD superfamily hydrolase
MTFRVQCLVSRLMGIWKSKINCCVYRTDMGAVDLLNSIRAKHQIKINHAQNNYTYGTMRFKRLPRPHISLSSAVSLT